MSLLRRVAVCAVVAIGFVMLAAVPASAGTARIDYLCTSGGSAATPATIEVTITAPATANRGDVVVITMIVVHGTTPRPLPTGARIAEFDLLVQGIEPERQRYVLANPAIPAGPINYRTSAQLGMPTNAGVVNYRAGNISFPNSEVCVPRNPGSTPMIASTVVS